MAGWPLPGPRNDIDHAFISLRPTARISGQRIGATKRIVAGQGVDDQMPSTLPSLISELSRRGTHHHHGVSRRSEAESLEPRQPAILHVAVVGTGATEVHVELAQIAADCSWKCMDRTNHGRGCCSERGRSRCLVDCIIQIITIVVVKTLHRYDQRHPFISLKLLRTCDGRSRSARLSLSGCPKARSSTRRPFVPTCKFQDTTRFVGPLIPLGVLRKIGAFRSRRGEAQLEGEQRPWQDWRCRWPVPPGSLTGS